MSEFEGEQAGNAAPSPEASGSGASASPSIPPVIRRAMEAQAARTGKIDVAKIEEALAHGDPIPSDQEEAELDQWRTLLPDGSEHPPREGHDLSDAERAIIDRQMSIE